jgi:hypothetical protein
MDNTISNVSDLMKYFDAKTAHEINDKFSERSFFIGAIKLITNNGVIIPSDGPKIWNNSMNSEAIVIEGLIEGTCETVNSAMLVFPFAEATLEYQMDLVDAMCLNEQKEDEKIRAILENNIHIQIQKTQQKRALCF